ncbi:MAG: UDP-3-O-acyl-N-acetylglucosamine deacetylase [Chlamydiales bacterium]|nr:UDP-3-O-acyl-N-acetylglucosamine deacetylase [Chlamydiales bacterium]
MSLPCKLSRSSVLTIPSVERRQHTLRKSASISGIGVFTGQETTLTFHPSVADQGIIFQRTDLPNTPKIIASLDSVCSTPRCTIIGDKKVSIQMVEHLLASLRAHEIDNILIQVSGPEVPILDGSSKDFSQLIEEVGVMELKEEKKIFSLQSPISWSNDQVQIIAIPANEYRLSYTLHYPHCSGIGTQFHTFVLNQKDFVEEIAPCRTFSIYEEVIPMMEKGFIKKGGLENAILVKDNKVMNPEGLRYPNEMARHKILDLIGDLSLIPVSFLAHIIAIRSGHTSNNIFAKLLYNQIKMENF